MKNIKTWVLVMMPFAACQLIGCGSSAPVDTPPSKLKNNLSPAHKALIEQRKKEDGG